jgi:putative autoinducer-2 (AI-2) aldolase
LRARYQALRAGRFVLRFARPFRPTRIKERTMPEADAPAKAQKEFFANVPQESPKFFLKGSSAHDWGMNNRLARIFNPQSGKAVMLAFDHGYFQGPTTGLERVDLSILPLAPYADALMLTRGILRSVIPPAVSNAVVMRASGGPSILKELSNEQIAVSMEDAIRMNVSAVAVQVFIGGEFETQSVANMTRLVDEGNRYGIPVLAVTAVGKDLARDAKYMRLACRICAELGAAFVKTYYVDEDFETVSASCPVPLVIAGGKKLPELDALRMAHAAISQGAAGVDMGRNIFQAEAPVAMIQAVRKVVHEGMTPEQAFAFYESAKGQGRKR